MSAMHWLQNYDPLGWWVESSVLAALPIVLLSVLLLCGIKAHKAALAALLLALVIAVAGFGMPWKMALISAGYGAGYGLVPIAWIVLAAVFLYNLTVRSGQFEVIKQSVAAISPDRRMQTLLIAFCFGSFLEGCAGFGTPVAISAALLIGLGFSPLPAAVLCLLANTAPVAFGGLGIPVNTLAKVADLSLPALTQMVGRQLPLFSLIIPVWLIAVMSGWRGVKGCWPALVVCGVSYATIQFCLANFQGPALVDVSSGLGTLVILAVFLRFWHPKEIWRFPGESEPCANPPAAIAITGRRIAYAWMPWLLLTVMISLWGCISWQQDRIAVPGLHGLISRTPPAVAANAKMDAYYDVNFMSATGTCVLFAAILSALWLRLSLRVICEEFARTLHNIRWALFTIACMLSLAHVIKYSGQDVTMGMLFIRSGRLYPLFAPFLGWLGVAVTGSDTSANAMFGSLQCITAKRLGLNPILIAASNSSGGVMGKMIAAQSIVIAAAATKQSGQESRILRRTLLHSIALTALMGLLTLLQAHVLKWMVPPWH